MGRCVPGLVRLLVEAELIVHILSRICDYVDGGRGVVIRRAVWLAATKDIGEKRIMIGRDCGFFVGVDPDSSLENDRNCDGCYELEMKRCQGDSTPNLIP